MSSVHIDDLIRRYIILASERDNINLTYQALLNTFRSKHKILICGNGGSSADADHWAAELLKGFAQKRPISKNNIKELPNELAQSLQCALPAIPLSAFTALTSAYANDVDAQYVFAQLVFGLATEGDALVAISTSGNSKNILHALTTAKSLGVKCIGLTGKNGGKMRDLCDVCICVPEVETHKIQELHLPIYHTLSFMLEDAFFG